MSDAVRFDVVIPAVTATESLKVSVRSALVSPLVNRVIVVVTNNQVRNLAMALAFEDPRVRVLAAADTRGASCNAGIGLCSSDWIAFLDEGDQFGERYFENLAAMITDDFRLGMIFTRLLNSSNNNADDHPLRFRFTEGNRVVDLADAPELIASSAVGAVFNREALTRSDVHFREDLNWSVDLDFVVRFLLESSGMVGVCADANYLFTETSPVSVANIWEKPNMYSHPFEQVYLPCAELALERYGTLPEWLQNMLLFELCSYVEVDRTAGHMVREMHKDLREWCAGLILATLEYLDADVIERFSLKPLSIDRRMMFLARCKQAKDGVVGGQVFEGVKGQRRGVLEFSYFWKGKSLPSEQIKVGTRYVAEVEGTWISQRLFGVEFVRERVLRFMGNEDEVRFLIAGQEYGVGPYRGSMSLIDQLDLAKAAEIASGGKSRAAKPEFPVDDFAYDRPIDAPTPGRRFKKAEPEEASVAAPAPVAPSAPEIAPAADGYEYVGEVQPAEEAVEEPVQQQVSRPKVSVRDVDEVFSNRSDLKRNPLISLDDLEEDRPAPIRPIEVDRTSMGTRLRRAFTFWVR